eukprot:11564205-Alexandrium_andersonii.AAC.1
MAGLGRMRWKAQGNGTLPAEHARAAGRVLVLAAGARDPSAEGASAAEVDAILEGAGPAHGTTEDDHVHVAVVYVSRI